MALAMPIYGREHSTFAIGRRAPEGDFRRAAFGICQYPTSPLLQRVVKLGEIYDSACARESVGNNRLTLNRGSGRRDRLTAS